MHLGLFGGFFCLFYVVFCEIRIFNILVSSAAGITGDNLIKCVLGLGQKRVLWSVAAVT